MKAEIFPIDWCAGVSCAYTGRIDSRELRQGPGRRRVWSSEALASSLGIDKPIIWLNQTHSLVGVDIDELVKGAGAGGIVNWNGNMFARRECDYAWSKGGDAAIAISVADCVPVALCDDSRGLMGICHAGWRGLARNVIGVMLDRCGFDPARTRALIGPHIHKSCFEIDQGSRDRFVGSFPGFEDCFSAQPARRRDYGRLRYLCDLNAIAREQLRRGGINDIEDRSVCTRCGQDERGWRFPSYRRDRGLERITMLVWKEA